MGSKPTVVIAVPGLDPGIDPATNTVVIAWLDPAIHHFEK
jgi:hypothetical protein